MTPCRCGVLDPLASLRMVKPGDSNKETQTIFPARGVQDKPMFRISPLLHTPTSVRAWVILFPANGCTCVISPSTVNRSQKT